MNDPSGYMVGGLFAFMMLGGSVAQPLVGLARLVEDYEEVGAAIGEAGSVLNRPLEIVSRRPAACGPALRGDRLPGRQLHLCRHHGAGARSGELRQFPLAPCLASSGAAAPANRRSRACCKGSIATTAASSRSTARNCARSNLRHLRQSFGVVLQDNFLFRGSIRDNIIAGRPGLTLSDAMQAARLAGAEEFIERMPNGYETYVEEGSPNLSGGQRQRLAIARALIHDPAHLDSRRSDQRARSGKRGRRERQSARASPAGARWSSSPTAWRRWPNATRSW